MKYLVNLFAATILLTTCLPDAFARDKSGDFDGVLTALQKYFDGTSKGTPAILKDVFMPGMKLQFVRDGKAISWNAEDYVAGFKEGVMYPRVGRVISIDITNAVAMVKAEIEMNDQIYVDYLLLLKEAGQWKITNKVFSVR
ncbi:nuclear transport factor 2 family protein [Aliiglaciecola sp. M165]|uniref:nuclear transport factor 2 family protein n=1 Tax=Aliiglaciecola sp. M165 TaxID=2593649 RepID=UPI00117E980C|nr:nuclear transport factor 2 family protein [Aliiglaciecola sp. M165]TRY31775.1 nuclear transport factor 2 family protein [Aliiglaciecola sp. M165]